MLHRNREAVRSRQNRALLRLAEGNELFSTCPLGAHENLRLISFARCERNGGGEFRVVDSVVKRNDPVLPRTQPIEVVLVIEVLRYVDCDFIDKRERFTALHDGLAAS